MIDLTSYERDTKLRGYNGRVTVSSAVSARDGAKVLRRIFPEMTREQHSHLAAAAGKQAEQYLTLYNKTLDDAFMRKHGRLPGVLDYRICCIWDDSLFEKDKDHLRKYGYGETLLRRIAAAHAAAAGRSSVRASRLLA